MAAVRNGFTGRRGEMEQTLSPDAMANALWAVDELVDGVTEMAEALLLDETQSKQRSAR
jgi:hypothetical protein